MEYKQAGKEQLFSGAGCIVLLSAGKEGRESLLAVAGNGLTEIRVFLVALLSQQLREPPVRSSWLTIPGWDSPDYAFCCFLCNYLSPISSQPNPSRAEIATQDENGVLRVLDPSIKGSLPYTIGEWTPGTPAVIKCSTRCTSVSASMVRRLNL